MKKILLLTLILSYLHLSAQQPFSPQIQISPADSILLSSYPELELPASYKGPDAKNLPDVHDNSQFQYFRPIFNQYGWSCGQASSVGYNFTYEINRINNTDASLPENQFPPAFTFNFFNMGEDAVGVNYRYSLESIKQNGNPTVADYGGMGEDLSLWIDGYDKYYNGMKNRIHNIYTIHVGDEEGLQTLKYWLYDHLEGSPYGGLANFYTDLYGYDYLPSGTPEAGKAVITQFGPYNGHSMTFIGWNDNIRWDYNNDGQYTNDQDINGDGVVNMKDWEIGGVILANSWGDDWADNGFCYVMYNVLAQEKADGGIWNKQVNVFDVKQDYEPTLTFKIKLTHDSRNKIKVMAGVSADTNALQPAHVMEFPIFNYSGGDYYMQGNNSSDIYKTLEFGLDVTPLLSYMTPGEPARIFLQVVENDPSNLATGQIEHFSVMDYSDGTTEVPCPVTGQPLVENGTTTLSVVHSVNWDNVQIDTEELPAFTAGESYSHQLNASGGAEPYKWSIEPDYNEMITTGTDPNISGTQLINYNSQSGYVSQEIDFPFPFYGISASSVTVHVDGFLMFESLPYPLPYQVDDRLLFENQRMIAPLLSQDLRIYTNQGDGIWYEGDETHASFRWKGTVEVPGEDYHLDFTTTLFPDGRIEVYVNDYNNPGGLNRITGISNGDGHNYIMSGESNTIPAEEATKLVYMPAGFPLEASISDDGILNVDPGDDQKIYNLSIRATDDDNIFAEKLFQLSSGLIYDYSILAGSDNQIDVGETVELSFTVKNTGSSPINDLTLNAGLIDPYINFLDGAENIGTLDPGESVELMNAISFEVANFTPDNYSFPVNLTFASDSQTWESYLSLRAYAPSITLGTPIVSDGDNNRLDPGETADIILPLFNSGQTTAENVSGEIISFDPYLVFNTPTTLEYGNILQGDIGYDTVSVTVNENVPQGHTASFNFTITASPDIQVVQFFDLLIGRFPVYIVDLDPETQSGPMMDEVLNNLDILHEYEFEFPSNINSYQNLFVSLGRKFAQHILTDYEASVLKDFLEEGGNLYMEGGLTWYDDPQTVLHPMFDVLTEYINWHDADSVFGAAGTNMAPMEFAYEPVMSYYNYHLLPEANAFSILTSQEGEFNFAVANETDTYKTIASTIDFGALIDSEHPSTKKNLMAKMLDFFGTEVVITGTDREDNDDNTAISMACAPNPVTGNATLTVNISDDGVVNVDILDLQGNIVQHVAGNKTMLKGRSSLNVNLEGLSPGVYIGRLKTAVTVYSVKIFKIN